MGSLGLPATAMAVRSAFALLCFALLCGLAASSVGQSETETELTKREGEAAGNKLLVEQALESREVRGAKKKNECENLTGGRRRRCQKKEKRRNRNGNRKKPKKSLKKKRTNKRKEIVCPKGKTLNKTGKKCVQIGKRKRNRSGKKTSSPEDCKKNGKTWDKTKEKCVPKRKGKKNRSNKKKKKQNATNKKTECKNGNCQKKSGRNSVNNRASTVTLTCLTTAIQLLKFQKD